MLANILNVHGIKISPDKSFVALTWGNQLQPGGLVFRKNFNKQLPPGKLNWWQATVGIVTTVLQCRQGLIVWLWWGKCPVLQSLLSKGENNYIADQLTRGTFMFERKLDFHRARKKSITAKGKSQWHWWPTKISSSQKLFLAKGESQGAGSLTLAERQTCKWEVCRKPSSPVPLKVLCAASSRCEADVAESRALVWLHTELLLLCHLRPLCSCVSKLPHGHCQGRSCVGTVPHPHPLPAASPRSHSPAATPGCVSNHSSTTASNLPSSQFSTPGCCSWDFVCSIWTKHWKCFASCASI